MKRLEIIEFLKGYSIFTIIIYHFSQELNLPSPFDNLILFGGAGVHLFILLSGLGMYLSHLNKPLTYFNFLKKRVVKVYVPYIIAILIIAIISIFIPIYKNSLYTLGGHIFLYKMFDESIMSSYGYQLWFVSMILQFYIAFYAIAFLAERLSTKYFIIICSVISLVWIVIVVSLGKEAERIWQSFFLQYLWEFALGMVIASKLFKNDYKINFDIKPIHILLIGVLNCILYGTLAIKGGYVGKMINDLPSLIGYSSIAIWVYKLNIDKINRFFIFTGSISFSLYLLHIIILFLAKIYLDRIPMLAVITVALITTYMISIYYQKMIGKVYKIVNI
ncbi:acyltransferase 3 [Hymenobacter roseosalivarius DSM 11622]|uniref:Acyltransferase 3 n=1 Tax=Hymenobacter roseosalivarius DSM 11622 TaxID=645990 RepID=A0A1W1VKJ9_9BACT|nr:acyltransferase [Hymenobacter roseosalivarius]SMB93750.1 acyltransferase 3 [Hymenobacter roseosalivarius DSM 11622]